MIEERYVSFEVAKLLKEKGFNEPCIAVYEEKVLRINTLCDYLNSELSSYVCAPTHQNALDWLRKAHGIHIYVKQGVTENKPNKYVHYWRPVIQGLYNTKHFRDINEKAQNHFAWKFYDDFAKAVDDAIKYTLENLI